MIVLFYGMNTTFTISIQHISNPDSIEFRIEYLDQRYTADILFLFIYFKSIIKSKADIMDRY